MQANITPHSGEDSCQPKPKRGPRYWLGENETKLMLLALDATGWNVSWAARLLGEDRTTTYRRLRRLRVDIRAWRRQHPELSAWGEFLRRADPTRIAPVARL